MKYDAIIIDSLESYKNIAFDFGITNLRYNDEVMSLSNLISRYFPQKASSFNKKTLNLENCGKLNGILLFQYLKNAGFECALVSEVLEKKPELEDLLNKGAHAIIISTTWTFGAHEVKKATQLIRELDANIPIIVGGVLIFNSYQIYNRRNNPDFDDVAAKQQFYFLDDDPLVHEDIDIFITDRIGLKTLADVLYALTHKADYYKFNNTAFYQNGRLKINSQQPEPIDLDSQVIEWKEVDSGRISEILPVQLSFGCTFKCKFCNFFHKSRCYIKSREYINKELKNIKSLANVKMLRFVDDSMPAKTLKALCELMIEEQINIPWTTFVRLDNLTKENISLLQKANCVDLQVGIESGDNRILKNMDKQATAEAYLKIFNELSKTDISIRTSFIIGYPGENKNSIENTINFLNKLPADNNALIYVGFAPFILLPLAPIYYEHERKPFNLRGYLIDWIHDGMSFNDIPAYLKTIFLNIKDDLFFVYTGDPMDFSLPGASVQNVRTARQNLQKAIVGESNKKEIKVKENELKKSVARLQDYF